MAYFGPYILGTMALIATEEQRRRELLAEAFTGAMRSRCVSRCRIGRLPIAMR
jgi:hypothetical protein